MSQPGISVICHLKAYLIIWSVSIFWTTCHFFLSLGSNDSHRWQIDIKVCWVCIPVDYVTGRSEREWMQEWRTVPPPLELASSPSLTHTSHIPNISGLKYYLHNAVGSFFGYQHKADKEMMTSSWSHNWEKGNARARTEALGAQRLFHVSTQHYQDLETFAVKTHRNEFSMTPPSVVGRGLQLI